MKKKILWLGLSWLIVAAFVLASCAPAVPGEQEEEEEEEVGLPQRGGTLTVLVKKMRADVRSWDEILGEWIEVVFVCKPYSQHLMAADVSMGKTGTGEVRFGGRYLAPEVLTGELAESWELLQDPLRVVFSIRPGVYWAADNVDFMENRELTADDVVFSINRRLSDTARLDPSWLGEWVKSVTATGRYTVVVELSNTYPDWHYVLGWGCQATVQNPEMIEAGIEDWRNAVGTGPFMLTDYVSGSLIEYTRNPNYWDTTIIDGKEYSIPLVDKLVYPLIVDTAAQLAALRTGKVDIWEDVPWIYKDTLASTNPELVSWESESWDNYMIILRQNIGPPLDILEVRRAMMMAIDNQAIIDDLYGGSGVMQNFPIPATQPESVYTPLEKLPLSTRELYEYHPEKARQLLADANYPDGFDIEILVDTKAPSVDIMSMVKDYWADVNIDLELIPVDEGTQWGLALDRDYKHGLSYCWANAPTLAGGMCYSLKESMWNVGDIDDPIFEDLVARYNLAPTMDEANALLKQAAVRTLEQVHLILLPGANSLLYAWPWVKNYEGETMSSRWTSIGFQSIAWIDQGLKTDMGH